MKKILITALLLAASAIFVSLVYTRLPIPKLPEDSPQTSQRTVELAGEILKVAIADTSEEREKGLSGQSGLAPDEGMLFVFPEDGIYAFWMKDMRFSIDILWISREGVVVDMREDVSPDTYPVAFTPRARARYVLELPAGYSKEYNVRLGDIVRL